MIVSWNKVQLYNNNEDSLMMQLYLGHTWVIHYTLSLRLYHLEI